MFEKSLTDLVRGIRAHADDETRYVSQCMDECRKELRLESKDGKANAVLKLAYMQMMGYDISWAAFNMIEVMSSKKFQHKRIGYLAAGQSFHEGTDVVLLTTNMIKKDLASQNIYEAGVAMGALATFIHGDLARDLANDIIAMMSSTRPYLRKRSTLLSYKLFLVYPDALRPAFTRLKDKLEDTDPSVQTCAVNVICELARKNPKNYLSLAPVFFKLLTTSQNNWLRIKIIKLFAALTPLEPRLGKKLVEPLTSLIHSTPAMSLIYECINTMVLGMPDHLPSIQLCVQKLRIFIEDSDQNLKYLGLQSMANVLKIQPKAVSAHRELILACLDDQDESIRLRALDLLAGMVTKKNLPEIVKKLLTHVESSDGVTYRDEVVSKVIAICAQEHYQYITDFEWYVKVLVQLTHVEGIRHGKLLASQLLDVAVRVTVVRPFITQQMAVLLTAPHLHSGSHNKNGVCEVLYAAAWIVGEFASSLDDAQPVLEALLQPRVSALPGHIQAVFVHNTLKVYAAAVRRLPADGSDEAALAAVTRMADVALQRLPLFVQSGDLEVQERAVTILETLKYAVRKREQGAPIDHEILELFAEELNPVASKAQRKVPVPEGLDLTVWINEPPREEEEAKDLRGADDVFFVDSGVTATIAPAKGYESDDEDTKAAKRKARQQQLTSNPYYVSGDLKSVASPTSSFVASDLVELDSIPIKKLDVDIPIKMDFPNPRDEKKKKKVSKKERRRRREAGLPSESEEEPERLVSVSAVEDMPMGAKASDDEEDSKLAKNDPHRALNIDLDNIADSDLVLPTREHRRAPAAAAAAPEKKKKEKKEKKEKGDKKEKKHKHEHSSAALALEAMKEPAVPVPSSAPPVVAASAAAKPEDDLEFWLGSSASSAPKGSASAEPAGVAPTAAVAAAPEDKKDKKDKKEKKEKKEKSDKKDKKEKKEKQAAEEPAPSAVASSVAVRTDFPAFERKALAANDQIALTYEVRAVAGAADRLQVIISFTAKAALSRLEATFVDSLNVRRERGDGPALFAKDLAPGQSGEHPLVLITAAVAALRMRGSLTYMYGAAGDMKQGLLDFALQLPASSFVVPAPCTPDQFTALLTGGSLCPAVSLPRLSGRGQDLDGVLAIVCKTLHLQVIERVGTSASLCGSASGGHLCVLVKATGDGTYSIDGKASSAPLLSLVMDELKALLA